MKPATITITIEREGKTHSISAMVSDRSTGESIKKAMSHLARTAWMTLMYMDTTGTDSIDEAKAVIPTIPSDEFYDRMTAWERSSG